MKFLHIACALISGCAAQSLSAQPQPNLGQRCYRDMAGLTALAPLVGKVSLSGEPGTTTLLMQADATKPSAIEKEALVQWAAMREQCNDVAVRERRAANTPPQFMSIGSQMTDTGNALVVALYRGDLTFGEFNVKRMAAAAEFRQRWADAADALRRERDAAGGPEAVARSIAAMSPELRRQRFKVDSTECGALANRLIPEPAAPPQPQTSNFTMYTPTGPVLGSVVTQPATQGTELGGFLEGMQLGQRETDRRNYSSACMRTRGWQLR